MSHVSLIAGEARRDAVRSAVRALGDAFCVKISAAKNIFIKPDVGHYELQLAATHIDALRGVLDVIRDIAPQTPVVIGDAGHYGTLPGFRHFGYQRLTEEYAHVALRDLQEGEVISQTIETDRASLLVQRAREAVTADCKISIAMLKAHRQYGACLSVANWAEGTWIVPSRQTIAGKVFTRAPWLSAQGDNGAHMLLQQLYKEYPADVAVIDGLLGMEGEGPVDGTAIHVGVAIASMDAIAADAVGATLMGIDPRALHYLDTLAQKGMGTIDVTKTDVPLQTLRECARMFQLPFEQKNLR